MSDQKTTHMHDTERRISTQSAQALSKERRNKEKSEEKSYSVEDKRRIAREEHTNGSTPKSRL